MVARGPSEAWLASSLISSRYLVGTSHDIVRNGDILDIERSFFVSILKENCVWRRV